MSKVYTANIVMTSSRDAITKMFSLYSEVPSISRTFSEGVSELTQEELDRSFIVSPGHNNNLVEFEHSFGTNAGNLTVTFLETDGLFEQFYIGANVMVKMFGKLLGNLANIPGTSDKVIKGDEVSEFYARELSSEDRAARKKFVSRKFEDLDSKWIYFAYGIGTNMDRWAGPYMYLMIGADLEINSDGVKEITLRFAGVPTNFLSNKFETLRLDRIDGSIDRYKRLMQASLDSVIKQSRVEIGDYDTFIGSLKPVIIGPPADTIDVSDNVGLLIKKYISSVADTDNVIVIMPDLGRQYRTFNTNTEKFTGVSVNSGIDPFNIPNPGAPPPRIVFKSTEEILEGAKKLKADFVEKFYNYLGFGVEKGKLRPRINTNNSKQLPVEAATEAEIGPTETLYSITLETDSEDQRRFIPDYYRPLDKFKERIQNLTKAAKGSNNFVSDYEFVLIEESNIKVLNLWHKYGFIKDKSKPVLLFGPANFIKNTFYLQDVGSVDSLLSQKTVSNYKSVKDADINLYNNNLYRVEYFDNFIKLSTRSSFEEDSNSIGELIYNDPDSSEKAEEANIPVFRHNTPNPNVLSLSVNYKEYYLQAFNLGFSLNYDVKQEDSYLNVLRNSGSFDENSRDWERLISLIKKEIGAIDSLSFREIYGRIIDLFVGFDKDIKDTNLSYESVSGDARKDIIQNAMGGGAISSEIAEIIELASKQKILNKSDNSFSLNLLAVYLALSLISSVKEVDNEKPFVVLGDNSSPLAFYESLIKQLSEFYTEVNIRTLPFFGISVGSSIAARTVFLQSLRNKIIGSENIRQNTPYSGFYKILKFSHVITTSECYSEFSLFKGMEMRHLFDEIGNSKINIDELDDILKKFKSAEKLTHVEGDPTPYYNLK